MVGLLLGTQQAAPAGTRTDVETREFFRIVAERSALSREEAADLTRAAFEALGERLSATETTHLAARLPAELKESLGVRKRSAEKFGIDEFIRRISEHTGLTERETTEGVRAVFTTLREELGDEQFNHVTAQLPHEFRDLAALT
jgi:uncharacterized protein (DUF2267 family)